MNNYPPPTKLDELPDYYLGRLIVFEPDAADSCKWVVYDGYSKVRCFTRTAAVDYINSTVMSTSDEQIIYLSRADYFLQKAIESLDGAARFATGADKLLLERLAVKLRPYLVDIHNNLKPLLEHEVPNPQN